MWFRNTWSWNGTEQPELVERNGRVAAAHPFLGELELSVGPAPDGTVPELLFCDNETNTERLYGAPSPSPFPKDGINDHVVAGAATVNPARRGSRCAAWYRVTVGGGETVELRLRLAPSRSADPLGADPLGAPFAEVVALRKAEADEFYAELTPPAASADEANVMRQAFAGLLWSKQLYYYDVGRWLDGDPAQPPPPPRRRRGRNARWRGFEAHGNRRARRSPAEARTSTASSRSSASPPAVSSRLRFPRPLSLSLR